MKLKNVKFDAGPSLAIIATIIFVMGLNFIYIIFYAPDFIGFCS